MLVISDTKRIIKDVNDLVIIPSCGLWEIKAVDSPKPLGTYESCERATQIILDFKEAYKKQFMLKNCSNKLTDELINEYSKFIVYEFPEK